MSCVITNKIQPLIPFDFKCFMNHGITTNSNYGLIDKLVILDHQTLH